jgi:large subunit ribosomal protein L21
VVGVSTNASRITFSAAFLTLRAHICLDILGGNPYLPKLLNKPVVNPMYAVFSNVGQQVKAQLGDKIRLDYIHTAKEGDKLTFDKVLLVSDGPKVLVGTPFVGATVHATVVSHDRGKKIIVYKKKKRTDSHKRQGHRQRYTTVHIDSIEA